MQNGEALDDPGRCTLRAGVDVPDPHEVTEECHMGECDCTDPNSPCQENAHCLVSATGTGTCMCNDLYTWEWETDLCVPVPDPCQSYPCLACIRTTEPVTTTTAARTTPRTTTTTIRQPTANCPDKGSMVQWKGSRVSKLMSVNETTGVAWLRVNFPNNARDYDIVKNPYVGFMAYVRKKCGPDFITAFFDGRVRWAIKDYDDYYTAQYTFNRDDKQHTSAVMQFYRHTVGDLTFGSKKKDQFYLKLTGLLSVAFGGKDRDTCIKSVQTGTIKIESDDDAQVNWAKCAAWDKDLGW